MQENLNNFKCPLTGDEFYFHSYTTAYKGTEKIYKDKWGKQLVNPNNGQILIPIEKPPVNWELGSTINIGTGNDKSGIAKRNEQLKKRSKNHFKREILDRKNQMNKDAIRKFKE